MKMSKNPTWIRQQKIHCQKNTLSNEKMFDKGIVDSVN